MTASENPPLILLAAGGTGGHLFPAEALATVLQRRGVNVDLATDERASRYGAAFPARATHVIPSDTVRSRSPVAMAKTLTRLGLGTLRGGLIVRGLRPATVVGFGGYPTLPPVLAAALLRVPTVIHEQNAVMGRANRFLAPRVAAIATGFPDIVAHDPALAAKARHVGNPIRPAVLAAAETPYADLWPGDTLRLLVFGGSQGARVMSDIVPPAVERLDPLVRKRLAVTQQARPEDAEAVQAAYSRMGVAAEVAPFFTDLPARIAAAHLVVSRSGASTVAELAAIGRPSILVPLPGALDQDQLANARMLATAGGATVLRQLEFTPQRLAQEIADFAAEPQRLSGMARAAKAAGIPDAADRLADLVLRVANVSQPQT